MLIIHECPTCGNVKPGDKLFECSDCKAIHCCNCGWQGRKDCPICYSDLVQDAGRIEQEEDA